MRFQIRSAGYNEYPDVGLVNESNGASKDCFVEVTSLSTLEMIQDGCGYELVVDFHLKTIVVYDDYIE